MHHQSCPETAGNGILEASAGIDDDYHSSSSVPSLYEEQPLLGSDGSNSAWRAPPGFVWIQIGMDQTHVLRQRLIVAPAIMSNVFLSGFDGTVTASTYAVISSEFNAANTASWVTTSYLITSTAFQPLYGRLSDIFGRRLCFFVATVTFMVGCLGCAIAPDVLFLNVMRALTGIGGGGLMTMATIVNSDLIPFYRRGMYQALQNVLNGFGSICGASLGGSIVDSIGWRWCFLMQVPVSIFALFVGHHFLDLPSHAAQINSKSGLRDFWKRVDLSGACFLILGLSSQLIGLSLGGNDLPWSNIWVILSLVGSTVLLALFLVVEAKTSAIPLIPPRMLKGLRPISTQVANVCVGMAAYAFLFTLPLLFQVSLLESATKTAAHLAIPSLATPIGGLISGIIMSRWGKLAYLVRTGALLMCIGNLLCVFLDFDDANWKFFVYIIPANLGQGIVYPAILFTFLATFDHSDHAVSASTVYLIRSIGWVWGVAITSTILQNTLSSGLQEALSGVPDKWKVTSLHIPCLRRRLLLTMAD
ncbi:hypothetical protein MAP00_003938 [Monascus purpureus]|nr:hypothetical protein MAP00_003938 [Monascus purpureus]